MSDLAPLVAATLRDKVVHDLMEEVKRLREEKEKLCFVRVTNEEGLVHCERSIRDGYCSSDGDYLVVDFEEEHRDRIITVKDVVEPYWYVRVSGILMNPFYRGFEGDTVEYRADKFLDGRGYFEFHELVSSVKFFFSVQMNEPTFREIRRSLCFGVSFHAILTRCPPDTHVAMERVLLPTKNIDLTLLQS